jgi:hypothetical protein
MRNKANSWAGRCGREWTGIGLTPFEREPIQAAVFTLILSSFSLYRSYVAREKEAGRNVVVRNEANLAPGGELCRRQSSRMGGGWQGE